MKPEDAVSSLRLMWDKLGDGLSEMPQETALETMRVEACSLLLNGSIDDLVVVLCADMGTGEQRLSTTTVGELSALPGGRLNSLIFPSQPSEVEEKALLRWK
jgi:diphthamide biosynthesis methyltransferase